MITLRKSELLYKTGLCTFLGFSFFSAIFIGYTRVNNLFHVAALLFILAMLFKSQHCRPLMSNHSALRGIGLILIFLCYYSYSSLWSLKPRDLTSELTHSGYILIYIAMLINMLSGSWRNRLLWCVVAGITILCLYLSWFDFTSISQFRATTSNNPGPSNVIDLSGYAAIGIICSLMIFRETRQKGVLCLIPVLLAFMVLTQSRGPLIALLIALILTTSYMNMNRKSLISIAVIAILVIITIIFTSLGELLISRFGELYQQSFVRMSIWRHTVELISQRPFFGYGVDKQLDFLNYTGEHIRTTHNLYLAALLKGGFVGFSLLAAVLTFSIKRALYHLRSGRRSEAALLVFMLVFYCSQGMFVIANPAEFWYLFWFPLAVALAVPDSQNKTA